MSLSHEEIGEQLRAGTFKNGCGCHYCTGERNPADGYCARCDVKIETKVHWEDLPICDKCDAQIREESNREKAP